MLAHSHSSRFNGPGTGTLHTQQRGASPPKYLNRSVSVGVVAVSAGDAFEHRLVLAGSRVDGTAGRAGLRAVSGRHGDNPPATFLHFVGQDRLKLAPAGVEDRSVQSGFLPDIMAWLGDCAPSTGRHAARVQVLQNGNAEAVGDAERGPVVEVAPDTRLPALKTSNTLLSLPAATGSTLAARDNALRFSPLKLNLAQAGRQRQHLTVGKSERCRDTAVNSNAVGVWLYLVLLNFADEGNVPAKVTEADSDVFYVAFDLARVSELNPTNLLKLNLRPFIIELSDNGLSPLIAEAIVDPLFPRSGERSSAAEEGRESFFQVSKSLFEAGALHPRNPRILLSDLGYFDGLGRCADILLVNALVMAPPVAPLFKRYVINEATSPGELPEQAFLLGARAQSKPISTVDLHAVNNSTPLAGRQNLITHPRAAAGARRTWLRCLIRTHR